MDNNNNIAIENYKATFVYKTQMTVNNNEL